LTRKQLEHAIRAACDVANDTELWIFGSQAILGEYPDAPEGLRGSIEVDVQPKNRPEAVDEVDGALGELSQFHSEFGFYVHGIPIDAAKLPAGWRERTVPVSDPKGTRGNTGYCLETHDLAASKLVASRSKDQDFVRVLLSERLIDPGVLQDRIRTLPISDEDRSRLETWVRVTAEDIAEPTDRGGVPH
jgi:hypothetical protein